MHAILILLLPSQMILEHFIGAFQGIISSHYFTGLTEPTHICNKKQAQEFLQKNKRKTWGTKRDPAPSGNNEHKCWWFHKVDNMENSE